MQSLTPNKKTGLYLGGGLGAAALFLVITCCACGLFSRLFNNDRPSAERVVVPSLAPVRFSTQAATPVQTSTPIPPTFTPVPPSPTPAPPTPTKPPTPTAVPQTPAEKLQTAITAVLNKSNRDIPRVTEISLQSPDVVNIKWTINDNLTEEMIKTGVKIDLKDMLKALNDSGIEYGLVNFEGSFSMVDQLGNTKEMTVVWATYEAATIKQINWPNFLHKNVYNIASTAKQHPAFQD